MCLLLVLLLILRLVLEVIPTIPISSKLDSLTRILVAHTVSITNWLSIDCLSWSKTSIASSVLVIAAIVKHTRIATAHLAFSPSPHH